MYCMCRWSWFDEFLCSINMCKNILHILYNSLLSVTKMSTRLCVKKSLIFSICNGHLKKKFFVKNYCATTGWFWDGAARMQCCNYLNFLQGICSPPSLTFVGHGLRGTICMQNLSGIWRNPVGALPLFLWDVCDFLVCLCGRSAAENRGMFDIMDNCSCGPIVNWK